MNDFILNKDLNTVHNSLVKVKCDRHQMVRAFNFVMFELWSVFFYLLTYGFTSLTSTPINSPLFRNITAQQTHQPELKRYEELLRKVSSLTSAETEEFANLESRITREQRKQIEDKSKLQPHQRKWI